MSWLSTIRDFFARGHSTRGDESGVFAGRPDNRRDIRAGYDLAQTHDENSRHFANADNLSARAANSSGVRQVMRIRSRYEAANNAQMKRILKAYTKDIIGTGPRLQLTTGHEAFDEFVTRHWKRWMDAVRYVRKLKVTLRGRVVNGESFRQRITNPELATSVKLDIKPFEADRCASPYENIADPLRIDGIDFDQYGNPTFYRVLDRHPGDLFGTSFEGRKIPAKFVTHWFDEEREEQLRGVPELHSATESMAHARRFRRATVLTAESAAAVNGVLSTDVPAGTQATEFDPGPLDLDRNSWTVLPEGWKQDQFDAKHPNDTYDSFNRSIATDAGGPLGMTSNVSTGDSSQYNFSSTRYDGEHWFGEVDCQRQDCELLVIKPDFDAWFAEFILTDDFAQWRASEDASEEADDGPERVTVEAAIEATRSGDAVGWEWDGHPQLDQVKSATGSDMDIAAGRSSTETETAAYGRNARRELEKEAKYLGMDVEQFKRAMRIKRFGFDPTDPNAVAPGTAAKETGKETGKSAHPPEDENNDPVPNKIRQRSAQPAGSRA